MGTRRRAAAAAAAAVVLVAGCQGVPDEAFNGGDPVMVPSWYLERGPVVRFPDGSTLVSRHDPDTGTSSVRKLNPDGPIATGWGVGGEVEVPFIAPSGSGATDGVALPDGSVILRGWQGPWLEQAVRLTPSGAPDTGYGTGGVLALSNLYTEVPFNDACELLADGSFACATVQEATDELQLRRYSPAGADLGATTTPVDLDQFAVAAPPGTTTIFGAAVNQVAVDGDDVVVAVRVSTSWWSPTESGSSDADLVVLRVRSGSVDPSFGTGGYRLVDLEVDGSGELVLGAGPDEAGALELAVGTDGAVTLVVSGYDLATFGTTFGGVRLTGLGAFDTGSGGDGVWSARLPDSTVVDVTAARVRPDGHVTLGGSVPDGADTRGVALRVLPTGLLDTGFDGDGVADAPSSRDVHAIDDRNGRVTVGGSGATIDPGTMEADVVVVVLTG